MTNFERIIKTKKELAEFIFEAGNGTEYSCVYCKYHMTDKCPKYKDWKNSNENCCIKGIVEWLESEAEK